MGNKLKSHYPRLLGAAYTSFLLFFVIFGVLLFLCAIARLKPTSTLNVSPAINPPFPPVVIKPIDNLVSNPQICKSAWLGLDILDLAILSELAYASTLSDLQQRLTNAFKSTSMSDPVISHFEPMEKGIHLHELYFKQTDLTVLCVRGTSTALEIYEDAHIYSGIAVLQLLNLFFPFNKYTLRQFHFIYYGSDGYEPF